MRVHVSIVGVLVAASFAGGWLTASSSQKQAQSPASQATPQTQPVSTNTLTEPVDIYSGNGMSPAALYDTLNNLSGIDFDKRYINYVILMQADLTGMNRLAKEKSVAPALKERATQLWELDSQQLTDLYALQKVLGYSHH